MKHIYLSGPMTGISEFNYPAFHAEAKRLRDLGYTVSSPAEVTAAPTEEAAQSWEHYMKRSLLQMLQCNTVALLDGWEDSKGVLLEVYVAEKVGMRIIEAKRIVKRIVK